MFVCSFVLLFFFGKRQTVLFLFLLFYRLVIRCFAVLPRKAKEDNTFHTKIFDHTAIFVMDIIFVCLLPPRRAVHDRSR